MELDDNDKEDEEMGEVKEEKQGKRNEQELKEFPVIERMKDYLVSLLIISPLF